MQGDDLLPRAVEKRWYGGAVHDSTDERETQRRYGDPQHDPDPSSGPEPLFRPWSPDDSDDFDGSNDSDDEPRAPTTDASSAPLRLGRLADD